MARRYTVVAWAAATATYLLIILGAIVRITGSGLGCGEHWPLCNGSLLPPLDLPTMIEYGHRLAAAAVTVLVVGLAAMSWRLRPLTAAPYWAIALLVVQIALGAITVKLSLPAWTVILHLGTAMLLLATLLVAARGTPAATGAPGLVGVALGFATVLMGALTANMGAAAACVGFPLCNAQLMPATPLQHIQWTHRLLAYALAVYVVVWAARTRRRGVWWVVALVAAQVAVAAGMVLLELPPVLQAAHVAVGAAVWAGLVLAAL